MSQEIQQPQTSASSLTRSEDEPFPMWLIILLFLLLYWGAVYFDATGGWFDPKIYGPYRSVTELESYVPRHEGPDIGRGAKMFNNYCAVCHGPDGAGKPAQAPPLAGSEWVNAEGINRLARIPMLGLNGIIEVRGQQYNIGSGMTAVAQSRQMFPDDVLADILSYIRQAWGNKAGPVTAAEVGAIRDEIGNRTQQLTVDEIKKIPK